MNLSSITLVNLHALAIDEHREPFQATIWSTPRFKAYTSVTEQVWFPGAHADIGGGYIRYDARGAKDLEALDDIALDWMLRRLRHHFPKFPVKSKELRDPGSKTVVAQQHEPRNRIYGLKRFALRSIANYPVPVSRGQRCVSFDRHATPTGEAVHISALERLGKVVRVEGKARIYEPQNLLAVLRHIRATYSCEERSPGAIDIPVVDWSGEILEPREQVAQNKVREVLQCAVQRSPKMHEMLDQLPGRSPPPICSLDDDANVKQRNYEAQLGAGVAY